jgi:hypothetical protein
MHFRFAVFFFGEVSEDRVSGKGSPDVCKLLRLLLEPSSPEIVS